MATREQWQEDRVKLEGSTGTSRSRNRSAAMRRRPSQALARQSARQRGSRSQADRQSAKPQTKEYCPECQHKKTTADDTASRPTSIIVYPAHGVGAIRGVEEQDIAGQKIELFVISFDKDKMTLRVPTAKAEAVGMRKLATPDTVKDAIKTLKGRARIKRTMWSRRAQEYEAKINSGDLISIAEVVRDLHRATGAARAIL